MYEANNPAIYYKTFKMPAVVVIWEAFRRQWGVGTIDTVDKSGIESPDDPRIPVECLSRVHNLLHKSPTDCVTVRELKLSYHHSDTMYLQYVHIMAT